MRGGPGSGTRPAHGAGAAASGTRDLQVGAEDLAALSGGRPDAEVVQLSGANHVFKFAPSERTGNFALYRDPGAPLHPDTLPSLVRFIEART